MNEPLMRVEEKLAYQEQTVETLSETVYQQQRRIEGLEETVRVLAGRVETLMEALRSGDREGDIDECPPHY